MHHQSRYFILLTAIIIFLLSLAALTINHFITQFPGNNYFPPGCSLMAVILFLIVLGTYLIFDKEHLLFKVTREFFFFFLVMFVIAFASNAIQFTPFTPIDEQLIAIDHFLGIHLDRIVAWTQSKTWVLKILAPIYDSISDQMCYLPLIIILARKQSIIREYYALLLISSIIGFVFYYFFPTIGPASALKSSYFSSSQYATGIKFRELHQGIIPSTAEGGMIAMPSYHVIWALLCLNLLRCWPIIFALAAVINLLLIASCVLLGWHYFIDLVGSIIVFLLSCLIYRGSNYLIFFTNPVGFCSSANNSLLLTFVNPKSVK